MIFIYQKSYHLWTGCVSKYGLQIFSLKVFSIEDLSSASSQERSYYEKQSPLSFLKKGNTREQLPLICDKHSILSTNIASQSLVFVGVRVRIRGLEMFVFRKIWRTLFFWNIRFEIRPFALLPTICPRLL